MKIRGVTSSLAVAKVGALLTVLLCEGCIPVGLIFRESLAWFYIGLTGFLIGICTVIITLRDYGKEESGS